MKTLIIRRLSFLNSQFNWALSLITLLVLTNFSYSSSSSTSGGTKQQDYSKWQSSCAKLAPNSVESSFRQSHCAFAVKGKGFDLSPLKKEVKEFCTQQQRHLKKHQIKSGKFGFIAQKLVVPSNAEVVFHGDLHGDIYSLMAELKFLNEQGYLDGFKIIKEDCYLVFLGDYTDRGQYGAEVIYTLLRLKRANPKHVFMVRGNHEDVGLNCYYGFFNELVNKDTYGAKSLLKDIDNMYNFLPVVLYVGVQDVKKGVTNYVQCCHGGIEHGYDPKHLLDSDKKLNYQKFNVLKRSHCKKLLADKDCDFECDFFDDITMYSVNDGNNHKTGFCSASLGFMWNDFAEHYYEGLFRYIRGGSIFEYDGCLTDLVINNFNTSKSKIRDIFRAHQHVADPEFWMHKGLVQSRGIYKLWADTVKTKTRKMKLGNDKSTCGVWTFNVAPDSQKAYFDSFNFDTFGILQVAPKYDDWRLVVQNTLPLG